MQPSTLRSRGVEAAQFYRAASRLDCQTSNAACHASCLAPACAISESKRRKRILSNPKEDGITIRGSSQIEVSQSLNKRVHLIKVRF